MCSLYFCSATLLLGEGTQITANSARQVGRGLLQEGPACQAAVTRLTYFCIMFSTSLTYFCIVFSTRLTCFCIMLVCSTHQQMFVQETPKHKHGCCLLCFSCHAQPFVTSARLEHKDVGTMVSLVVCCATDALFRNPVFGCVPAAACRAEVCSSHASWTT